MNETLYIAHKTLPHKTLRVQSQRHQIHTSTVFSVYMSNSTVFRVCRCLIVQYLESVYV